MKFEYRSIAGSDRVLARVTMECSGKVAYRLLKSVVFQYICNPVHRATKGVNFAERYIDDRQVVGMYTNNVTTVESDGPAVLLASAQSLEDYPWTALPGYAVSTFRRLYPGSFKTWVEDVCSGNIGVKMRYYRATQAACFIQLPFIDAPQRNRVAVMRWRMEPITVEQSYINALRLFGDYKDRLHRFGGLLAQAIRDDDDSDVAELFLDVIAGSQMGRNIISRLFDHYKAVLDEHNVTVSIGLADCGHYSTLDDMRTVHTSRYHVDEWCEACAEENARIPMDDDNNLWATERLHFHSDEEWYTYEEDTSDDDDHDSDSRHDSSSVIQGYSTNVLRSTEARGLTTRFGDFTMGIELEMTSGRDIKVGAARRVLAALGDDYCIIKNDGSLPDNGFEVVTAPRLMAEHIEKFTAWTPDSQWRAWDAGSCGMHVHIDSRAFTALTLGKLLMFFNKEDNGALIRRIAGRHPNVDSQARDYAALESQSILVDPNKALKGKHPSRYRIVNTTNLRETEMERLGVNMAAYNSDARYNTIEIRIFRASLKRSRLLAQIEFANAVVFFCRETSYRDLNEACFLKWLGKTAWRYPNLADWFGVRTKKAAVETSFVDSEATV